MNGPRNLHVYVHAPHLSSPALTRTARSGIYLVRDVPRDLQQSARARAVRDGTTLRAVLLHALHEYATGRWTPARSAA